MIEEVFNYLDRVISLVRPKKILYLAIDGVAPRAKVNQQRARRFKTAKDEEKNKEIEENLRHELEEKGEKAPEKKNRWDSNLITPGTKFMDKISQGIRWYIHDRLNNSPGWKGLTVIFSDGQVPGEGEHKIAEFIRTQRALKGYNPKTKHVIYGLDADLIMLALATHEPNFTILREKVFLGGKHIDEKKKEQGLSEYEYKPFQFLNIATLRKNLQKEFSILRDVDFERIIDDFVFLCFFVGNDFLPHLPSLDIKEGAIDFLLRIYKQEFFIMGGCLVEGPKIHFEKVQHILKELAQTEDNIFFQRLVSQRKQKENRERRKKQAEDRVRDQYLKNPELLVKLGEDTTEKDKKRKRDIELLKQNLEASNKLKESLQTDLISLDEPESKKVKLDEEFSVPKEQAKLTPIIIEEIHIPIESPIDSPISSKNFYQKETNLTPSNFLEVLSKKIFDSKLVDENKHPDDVLLGETGWKQRYYKNKFKIPLSDDYSKEHRDIFKAYTEGLAWIMKYYYEGCPSWSWYYPYHYSPFSSDLIDLSKYKIEFEMGEPFQPFSQLLAVFPSNSSHALPKEYSKLMTEKDSPIIDFYPKDFDIDLNGKRFEYQGVVLLPFIDEIRLLKAVDTVKDSLNDEEKRRNSIGKTQIYAHLSKYNPLGNVILELNMGDEEKIEIPEKFAGCRGFLEKYDGGIPPSDDIDPPFKSDELQTIKNNMVMSASFYLPPPVPHESKLLEGAIEFKEIEDKMENYNVPTNFGSSKYQYKKEEYVNESRDPRSERRDYQRRDNQYERRGFQNERRDNQYERRENQNDRRDNYQRRDSQPERRDNQIRDNQRDYQPERRDNQRDYQRDNRREHQYERDNQRVNERRNYERRDNQYERRDNQNERRDQRYDNRRENQREYRTDNRNYERRDNDRRNTEPRYDRTQRTIDPRIDNQIQPHPYQLPNQVYHPYQTDNNNLQQIQRNIQEILEKIPSNPYSLLEDDQNNN